MIQKLKKFFEAHLTAQANESSEQLEHRLQLACAVLLIEVARMDNSLSFLEEEQLHLAIQAKFELSESEIKELLELADEERDEATDYHQFTQLLNGQFDLGQKIRLVELMWQVALADGHIDQHEDHFIRKIADLLYLRHSELISARERMKKQA